jgi:hypothetical protein
MANNVIQHKRTSTAGRQPNTTNSANSQYINPGELALNMTDQILYTSDGTNLITVGANQVNQTVSNTLTVKTISANGSPGTANQVLTSNGSSVYWANTGTGGFTNGQSISVNNFVMTGAFTANSSNGLSGQVLTSNGTGVYWSSGGGGGGIVSMQQFTGDGSTTTFTFVGGYTSNSLAVYVNGILQRNGAEANVSSGSTFTITPAPPSGALIDALSFSGIYANGVSASVSQQFTANGTANSFTIAGGYIPNQVLVFVNGVKQIPGTDVNITSGNTVNLVVTPANGYVVDVYGVQSSVTLASNTIVINGTITANAYNAGGSVGSSGQVLTSNGSASYWANNTGTGSYALAYSWFLRA